MRAGRIIGDASKLDVLTAQPLSGLFDLPVKLK